MISVVLLVLFGAIRLAQLGDAQLSADGSAYIAAKTAGANTSANGAGVASGVFRHVPIASLSTEQGTVVSGASVEVGVVSSYSSPGFPFVGSLATFPVHSHKIEQTLPSGSTSNGTPLEIHIVAQLNNVLQANGTYAAPPSIYVAQHLNPSNTGGTGGRFSEWFCHYNVFTSLVSAWPASRPAALGVPSAVAAVMTKINAPSGWDANVAATAANPPTTYQAANC